ncbi:MAG TPA: type IV pilin [Methanomicrobiales archaeon]|nr:type IV pilin [Methanomicrobiales archaeon]
MPPCRVPPAISPVIGAMLLVGLTVVLSALVYLLVLSGPPVGIDPSRFQYIRIMEIRHAGDTFTPQCDDSCIRLIHEGNAPLRSNDLSAVVLRNNVMLKTNITTLNAGIFYTTKHDGAEYVTGPGSEGPRLSTWDPGEEIYLDLTESKVGPTKAGDVMTVRIVDKESGLVISEDTARA